jgi:hypothetical protein
MDDMVLSPGRDWEKRESNGKNEMINRIKKAFIDAVY